MTSQRGDRDTTKREGRFRARCARRRRKTTTLALALAFATPARSARADNPLNSSEKPASTQPSREGKTDFTIVPVVGGSTDVGIGAGFFSALTREQRGYDPFLWNTAIAGFVTFALHDGDRFQIPYADVYGKFTLPRFLGKPLRFDVRPSFTDEERLYYYGMGNASTVARAQSSNPMFQYGRIHPTLLATLGYRIVDHMSGTVGIDYTASWLQVAPGSKLAADAANGSAEVKRLVGPLDGQQSLAVFEYGFRFDTRDSETRPHAGTWDDATIKMSPGGAGAFPFRYGQATVILRGYVPLSSRFTLAGRIVADVLFGDVPFAELPRVEDTYALGGSNGVRGIPAQRYYGKVKVLGNVELRARLFDFRLFKKKMTLGAASFFDGGRLWADTNSHPELDGTGFGLKYGIGAGLRLMSGAAFVLRADVAWSPDASPVGGYVAAGEMF